MVANSSAAMAKPTVSGMVAARSISEDHVLMKTTPTRPAILTWETKARSLPL